MKLIMTFLTAFSCALAFGQDFTSNTTIEPLNDSTFTLVVQKTYSNGIVSTDRTPVTVSEVTSNIRSFLEFKAREYSYAAVSTYNLESKREQVDAANTNLKNAAGIDVLGLFAAEYQSQIVGSYTLNGSSVTLSFSGGKMQWAKGAQHGDVTVYSADMICLKGYYNSNDVVLYRIGDKFSNADGLFIMQ